VALEKLDDSTFRSIHLAYGPADGGRTYGGHVYMQVCIVAFYRCSASLTDCDSP